MRRIHQFQLTVRNFRTSAAFLKWVDNLNGVVPYDGVILAGKVQSKRRTTESNRIGVIGVPFHKGQSNCGVEDAPSSLREFGVVKDLIDLAESNETITGLKAPMLPQLLCGIFDIFTNLAFLKWVDNLNGVVPYDGVILAGKVQSKRRTTESNRIGVIGVPFHKGQSNCGVEDAPSSLREFGVVKDLIDLGHNVKDYGDINCDLVQERHDVPDKIKNLPDLAFTCHALSTKVQEVMTADQRKVLTVGGDHSIALGSVDGHVQAKKGNVCLLWVGAHADLNTADTSQTGHMHGMPVSLLVKELADYWPYLPGLDWQKPTLSMKNLAYIGLRSVDHFERLMIEKYGASAFGTEDIEKYGVHTVATMALDRIDPDRTKSLHVSFDINSLDAHEAPCTGTSVRGGLMLREAIHILEMAHRTGRLEAVDIVEINPRLGNSIDVKTTLEAAVHVIKAAFGHRRSGNVPPHIERLPGFYSPPKSDQIPKEAND